ncbi:MAG: hypothetical protein Q8865_00175 [Bacillota bacterium]|nr:hypothetical protein [Bacillota bacterium]
MFILDTTKITPHETVNLHEILSFKNTCAVKSSTMQSLINDQELKGLANQDVTTTARQMQEIIGVIKSTSTTL